MNWIEKQVNSWIKGEEKGLVIHIKTNYRASPVSIVTAAQIKVGGIPAKIMKEEL